MYNEEVSKELVTKAFELAKTLLNSVDYEKNVKFAERFNNNSFKVVAILNGVFKNFDREDEILLNNGIPESLVRVIRTLTPDPKNIVNGKPENFYNYVLRINFCKSRMVKLIFIHMMKHERELINEQIESGNFNPNEIINEQLLAFAEYLVKTSYNFTEKRLKNRNE